MSGDGSTLYRSRRYDRVRPDRDRHWLRVRRWSAVVAITVFVCVTVVIWWTGVQF